MDPKVYEVVSEFIVEHYPVPIQKPHTFENIAMQIQEDIAILRIKEDKNWLAAGFICFPSGWRPEEKIGQYFDEMHGPVPGMNLAASQKIAESMVHNGPFERFVWSPIFEETINGHPKHKRAKFDVKNPCVHVRVERQLIYGFPEFDASLFVIRQWLIHEDDLDRAALADSIQGMSWNEKKYKGLIQKGRALSLDVCDYLRGEGKWKPEDPKEDTEVETEDEFKHPFDPRGTPEYDGVDVNEGDAVGYDDDGRPTSTYEELPDAYWGMPDEDDLPEPPSEDDELFDKYSIGDDLDVDQWAYGMSIGPDEDEDDEDTPIFA